MYHNAQWSIAHVDSKTSLWSTLPRPPLRDKRQMLTEDTTRKEPGDINSQIRTYKAGHQGSFSVVNILSRSVHAQIHQSQHIKPVEQNPTTPRHASHGTRLMARGTGRISTTTKARTPCFSHATVGGPGTRTSHHPWEPQVSFAVPAPKRRAAFNTQAREERAEVCAGKQKYEHGGSQMRGTGRTSIERP